MYLGKADVNTYYKGAGREFLVSNGHGSYGFSTVIGANTRKEHGLLVVRPKTCGAREGAHNVLFSKIEKSIFLQGKKYQLSTNRYKDLIYPDGFRYVQEYHASPIPTILYVIHSVLLRKSVFMTYGKNRTVIKYELMASPDKIRLDLRPLAAHRNTQEIISRGDEHGFSSVSEDGSVKITGRGMESFFRASAGEWSNKPLWFDHMLYDHDEDFSNEKADKSAVTTEDLWSPGLLCAEMKQGDVLYIVLSDEKETLDEKDLADLEIETLKKLQDTIDKATLEMGDSSQVADLTLASYHLVDEGKFGEPAIFTGYPSVDVSPRQTFMSLPGLTLATGREETAADILSYWSRAALENDCVMPGDEADSALWFVYAVQKLCALKDKKNIDVSALCEAADKIMLRLTSGADGLSLRDNGLLYLQKSHAMTQWMNGVSDEGPIALRYGFTVEINALWFNALEFAKTVSASNKELYAKLSDKCKDSFINVFYNPSKGYLNDWFDPDSSTLEGSIRPNQILAISLPHSPLADDMGRSVLNVCWNNLYTTYGLRTLDPKHEKFKGRFEGRPDQRMKARFRGMAWPWLLGHFISAYMKYNPERTDIGMIFLRPFTSHMRHGCLGGVAEYFDGLMPYRPHGDVLSAAGLGEVLRVLYEDLR